MKVKLISNGTESKVTQKVINDFNKLNDKEFFRRYSASKGTYLKRFIKYGDPYMNSPLAKFGKFLHRFM